MSNKVPNEIIDFILSIASNASKLPIPNRPLPLDSGDDIESTLSVFLDIETNSKMLRISHIVNLSKFESDDNMIEIMKNMLSNLSERKRNDFISSIAHNKEEDE